MVPPPPPPLGRSRSTASDARVEKHVSLSQVLLIGVLGRGDGKDHFAPITSVYLEFLLRFMLGFRVTMGNI